MSFDKFAENVSLMLRWAPEAMERQMSGLEALITAAGLGILATPFVALPRRPLVPTLVALVGLGILGALAVQWGSQPCQSDPAGCAMQRGYEGLMVWAAAVPLAVGIVSAITWQAVAGQDASLKIRLCTLITILLLMCVLGIFSTF